ncbi:hypothetical protein O988_05364 [Pseudogymnoascus sp. VKM F-3808]|nr:hypothetical protein O988_05364 [Pseudogymnoascus sp. VKM F-3808]
MSSKTSHSKLAKKPELYYTNEDVAILYDIVLHAEELLGSLPESERIPTNALFQAYYAILPTIGVNADHDNRYARVIFKIGGRRGGGSLYHKFEHVLSEMGIEIQFDQIEEEGRHTLHGLSEDSTLDMLPKPDFNLVDRPDARHPRRRNSETSIWTVGSGNDDGILRRPRSNSLQSKPRSDFVDNKSLENIWPRTTFPTATLSDPHKPSGRDGNAHRIGSWLTAEVDTDGLSVASQHTNSDQSFQERIVSHRNTGSEDDTGRIPFDTDQQLAPIRHIVDHPQETHAFPVSVAASGIHTGTVIENRIAFFLQNRNRSLLLNKLACWRQQTTQVLAGNRNLEALARSRDRYVLLKQGLETWVTAFREGRRVLETEHFFLHLERRAKRARDIFLLAKSFTHWATTASDEIHRTSVARRHILRTRFFKAWREITAVNELKVRRHIQKKFFNSWRRRQEVICSVSNYSVAVFHGNIVTRVFWLWFWSFCERRAPTWWADRAKRRQMVPWTAKLKTIREMSTVGGHYRQEKLKSLTWGIWARKTRNFTNMNDASLVMQKRSSCVNALRYLRSANTLLPSSRHIKSKVKHGLVVKFFNIWRLRTMQERQARDLDRQKIKREAWTAWNNKIRYQGMQLRIGDRNLLQALYKWVLAERLILARRLSNQKMVRAAFERMLLTSTRSIGTVSAGIPTALQFREQNDKRSILYRWSSNLKHHRNLQQLAIQRNTYPIQTIMLKTWSRNMDDLRQLQAWALDANFYFAATKALKIWRDATETSRREKRRTAYATVRRHNKLKLASRALYAWRCRSKSVASMESLASEFHGTRINNHLANTLARWRARKLEISQLESIRLPTILRARFIEWKSSSKEYHHLDVVAGGFNEDRLYMACMKKWGRLALQFRAHQHLVSELHDKHARRAVRKMVLHWRQQLFDYEGSGSASIPGTKAVTNRNSNRFDISERFEAYSDTGDDVGHGYVTHRSGGFLNSAPGRGYLKTPSKRTFMSRTANQPSTTPIAPLSTPYERQLRAELSGRLFQSYSRISNDNPPNINEGFEDLTENMRAVLPGKPQARLQAICIGHWDGRQLAAYITGNAFVVLEPPTTLIQTVYDEDPSFLIAIAFDEATGKIATCTERSVRIYQPYGQNEGALKWSLQIAIPVDDLDQPVTTLSWGGIGELLVGSLSLSLYSTENGLVKLWSKAVANPTKFACLSYDSGYIASTGAHDRLVKLWRRLSFGSDDVRFDLTYLPHPQTVTDVRWRRPYHLDQTVDNVLYTVSADKVLRIWAATDTHGLRIFQLWGQIDLEESIQPRSLVPGKAMKFRYTSFIDGRDFRKSIECSVQEDNSSGAIHNHEIEHLVEVANRSSEICIIFDEQGNMSAWGLENIGGKARKPTDIFNIAHVAGLEPMLPKLDSGDDTYIKLYTYCGRTDGMLNTIWHNFDGTIQHFNRSLSHLFDKLLRPSSTTPRAIWTGHSRPLKKMVRNISGKAVVSRTDGNEAIVWRHGDDENGVPLTAQSLINVSEHIHRICVLRRGAFVILLHHSTISLWDCRQHCGQRLASLPFVISGKPLCVLVLPEADRRGDIAHIATISSEMKGIVWELRLPPRTNQDRKTNGDGSASASIREFCTFDLGEADDLAYVLPVDPAGSPPVTSGFLDTFARDVAVSYTHFGFIRSWTAKVNLKDQSVDWLLTCSVETGIHEPSLASGSSIRKAALVNSDRSELTIWDVRGAQLEYSQSFGSSDGIQDLDWTSTPDVQSILAVGFQHRVLLLSQLRYDYLNEGPAWTAIREINIRDLTPHPIGDSTWLGRGSLLIGAGNQLFVYDKTFNVPASIAANLQLPLRKEGQWDLFDAVTRLNGPLPVFHPQFLGQCILAGKLTMVQRILLTLHQTLKSHSEGEHIDNLLGLDLEDFYTDSQRVKSSKNEPGSAFTDFFQAEDTETLTENIALALNEKLTTVAIPQLSGPLQIQLADTVECVAIVEKQRRSMDDNAARFMLFFRQHALYKGRANEVQLSWREINWAFHSNSQDILTDVVTRQFHGRVLWEHARESGLFMWITDSTALKEQFEKIARNEYTKSDEKNPIDCSLFYIALKKKAVLQGLWRMAGWNREQAATLKLLSNNFQEEKWKTVALKNAYALLGKHRCIYAAAFFLLADCLRDAVNVCLNQLKDLQLAIAITRVFEGENGPVLRELLEEKVLPLAAQEGNRWLASWAFWMLRRRDMAVRALIAPVYTLIETPQSPDMQSKLYLTDDPALIILYSQLRQMTLQTLRGASRVTPKVEWAFVLHSARLYDRMGCDILALDLVRNWKFLLSDFPLNSFNDDINPRSAPFRRRDSLIIADLPPSNNLIAKGSSSAFVEPEANSLLDSFGF